MKKTFLLIVGIFIGCTSPDQLMKHPLDKSEVKTFILENGIKVYLLSDPKLNVSAASMSVEVGSLEDPQDRQGLAHFLEHMLFLGTKKYPDVDEYSTYLKNYGGYANAYTASDHTNYQFQVLPDGFEGSLDRFSQFFISPLFTEEYTSREVNAVNSEYQKNILNDGWREFRIASQFAKEGHSERKFNIGNLETLGDIKREELIAFYKKHYSANRMGLSLLSTHSLEEMEKYVRDYFNNIKNNNLKRNNHDPIVINDKKTLRFVQVEPIKDIRDLNISFSIPSTRELYKNKPGRQFGFILGHEGKGSLLSYLKDKGWALTLSAGARAETKEFGYANIKIGLTEKGQKEYKDVIKATTDYIGLIKKEGFQKHVFNELKTMSALDEIYSSKGEGMWRATQLANEAMMYPLEDAGRVNYLYSNSSPESFEKLLEDISIDKMLVLLVAKGVKTDKEEHFFKIKYSYSEDDKFYKKIEKITQRDEFLIPEPNPFIPQAASVPNRKIKENAYPELISTDNGASLYFGQDNEFLRPKGVISFKILLPKEKMSLKHKVFSRIYVACVNESLNEISYPAKQAGLNYAIREGYEGIYVDVSGYTESSIVLLETVLDHLVNFTITNDQFLAIKDKIIRNYKNFSLSDAHQQTREMAPDILNNIKYTWKESLPLAEKVTLNEIKSFSGSLYEKTFVEALVYGDFDEGQAKKSLEMFNKKTKTTSLGSKKAFNSEYLQVGSPEDIQYVKKLMVNNSCFYRQYIIGKDSPKMRAASIILDKALQQPFYTEMRTNQQLGYIVWSYAGRIEDTYFLNFLIQSGEYEADELNKRADTFIAKSGDLIKEMEQEVFNQLVESAVEQLERKPMSIAEKAAKLKATIFEYNINYKRDQETINALKSLDKESIYDLLESTINSKKRKMINVLAFAENHKNKSNLKSSFTNLKNWKKDRVYK